MNERVVELLRLCLTAKEQGICVWFDYAPHCDAVNIYAFKEGWETTLPDEAPDRYFTFNIYLDWTDADERITAAEQAIKDLMKERGKD